LSELIEIKLPKCRVLLTTDEISLMLQKNPDIFETAIERGKAFNRGKQLRVPKIKYGL